MSAILGEFTPEGKQKSAHFVVSNGGAIWQCVSVLDTAYANGLSWSVSQKCWVDPEKNLLKAPNPTPPWQGLTPPTNPNWQTISIEREGFYREQPSAAENAAVVRILRFVHETFPTLLPAWAFMQTLIGHCHISPVARAHCPGPHVDYVGLAAAANAPVSLPLTRYRVRGVPIHEAPNVTSPVALGGMAILAHGTEIQPDQIKDGWAHVPEGFIDAKALEAI